MKNLKLSFIIPTKDRRGASWQYRKDVSFRHRVFPTPYSPKNGLCWENNFRVTQTLWNPSEKGKRFQTVITAPRSLKNILPALSNWSTKRWALLLSYSLDRETDTQSRSRACLRPHNESVTEYTLKPLSSNFQPGSSPPTSLYHKKYDMRLRQCKGQDLMYNYEDCSLCKDIQVKDTLAFLTKACVLECNCFNFPQKHHRGWQHTMKEVWRRGAEMK